MDNIELDSIDVAAYIAKEAVIKNYYIDLTKLQKILFACYGTYLAVTWKRLGSEHPKAWPHGPVFPRVYNFTKKHIDFIQSLLALPNTLQNLLTNDELNLLDKTVRFFSQYQAYQLVNWTHQDGSPLDISTNHGKNLQCEIGDNLISDYFKTIIKEDSNGQQNS